MRDKALEVVSCPANMKVLAEELDMMDWSEVQLQTSFVQRARHQEVYRRSMQQY